MGRVGEPGSYCLVLRLDAAEKITIGRLGTFEFPAGFYLYFGSALGPGGVEARVARHQRADKRRHWHIDYLLERASLVNVRAVHSNERLECQWAAVARREPGASVPAPRFGASDCRCAGHLVRWESSADLTNSRISVILRSIIGPDDQT